VSVEARVVPMVLVAALLARLALSDDVLVYLKPGMRPWLLVAAVTLVTVTLAWLTAHRRDPHRAPEVHGGPAHGSHGGGRLSWLLVLPLAAIIVVPPAPLGSFAAARQEQRRTPPPAEADGGRYPPLPTPVGGAHDMTLGNFVLYALNDTDRQLDGATVRMTGFVTPAASGEDGFRLTRFMLSCCAADATPMSIVVEGTIPPYPPVDTWLEIEGRWRPDPSGHEPDTPVVDVTSVREIPPPPDPYET
jgi:uncharacterized repeat protein (TIGR03943 family)